MILLKSDVREALGKHGKRKFEIRNIMKTNNTNKTTEEESQIPGERLYIDQSIVKDKSLRGKKNW